MMPASFLYGGIVAVAAVVVTTLAVLEQTIGSLAIGLAGLAMAVAFARHISRTRSHHDTTGRKLNQEAAGRLSALVQGSDDAIIDAALDGKIVGWNRGAEQLYGYGAPEAVGRHISILVPPDLHEEFGNSLAGVCRGERVPQHETVWVARSGVHVEVALTISPIRDAEGTILGISSVTRDIAEQRWMADTLDETLKRLQTALEDAQQAEARSRQFLADAAHQLRTPIAGLRACADTLLLGPPASQRDRLLLEMVNETSRAARLLASLLRMVRLDQGEPLTLAPCDVASVCRDEADRARSAAPHLDISVRTGHVEPRPEVDADAVREILANLLDNSRRHALRRIEIGLEVGDEWAELWVVDDGPGPPQAMMHRVFERFVSLDGKGGSGLGLPIARELARSHGGDLVYEGGFVIRLPTRAGTEEAAPSAAGRSASTTPHHGICAGLQPAGTGLTRTTDGDPVSGLARASSSEAERVSF